MIGYVNIGSTAKIRIFLFNGAAAQTGKTVNLSIERLSDGLYWDGDFSPGTYGTVAMTEKTGNVHLEGVYEYSFAIPSADGQETYDWSVKFADGGWTTYFKGRIRTIKWSFGEAMAELTQGLPPISPTPEEALMLLYMMTRNNRDTNGSLDEVHNDAGVVIAKATLSDDGTTFRKAKMESGP